MTDERLEGVKRRLQRSPALEAAVRRQIDGGLLERMGAPRTAVARPTGGADSLEAMTTSDALEAIVQRVGRPPLLIRNGAVDLGTGVDDSLDDFPPGTDALIRGSEGAIPSVGRVEFLNFRMEWGGTAWVIDAAGPDRIVATNRHVAALVAKRTVDGRGVFMRDPFSHARYRARVDFKEEVDSIPGAATHFEVADVVYLADALAPDVALMRITGANLPSPLPLADGDPTVDDLVALIGYPAFDDRNDLADMARYFRDLYNVKRFAPGKVTQALGPGVVLRHDCTSLGGNSGSPLIRLFDGAVTGLHFAGVYGVNNSAVGVESLRALLRGDRPASVRIASEQPEAASDGVHQPADLAGRDGYEPAFLGGDGLTAPWPGLPAAVEADLARPSDEDPAKPFEIRYTHFGVRFSLDRRQPLMTAVNIDGLHRVPIKRKDDKWFRDARVPLDRQLGRADFDDDEIDRGHLVRREDPNWDPAVPAGNPGAVPAPVAVQANLDTFHYTNAAPQHSAFNRNAARWLGIEDHILDSAETHGFRACVFTGPVVRDDDEPIGSDVIAPREFWKLVVMEDADRNRLHATAYLLSQGELIRDLLERRSRVEGLEGFVLGEYRTFQIAVADLAEATGYDLSAYASADPLARTRGGEEALGAGEPLFLSLDSVEDVVL